jgi:hypothetical protein
MKRYIVEYEAFNVGRHPYQHTTVPVRARDAEEARTTVESWAPGRVHVLSVEEDSD